MKKIILSLFAATSFVLMHAQVGIGTTSPNGKALLDLTSNNKGLLVPRMTAAERIAINPANPAKGLLVFDTDSTAFMFWTGAAWQKIASAATGSSGNAWLVSGNAATATDVLGTNNNQPLVLVSNGLQIAKLQHINASGFHAPNITMGSKGNTITRSHSSAIVSGGVENLGNENTIDTSAFSVIAGGSGNDIYFAGNSVIGGGVSNNISASGASILITGTISGGNNNSLTANYGTIAGGSNNNISSLNGSIGGGFSNEITGDYATIAGGNNNTTNGDSSVIAGGSSNQIFGGISTTISGGTSNQITGAYNVIGGGTRNQITSNTSNSMILGGYQNLVTSSNCIIGGSFDTAYGYTSIIFGNQNKTETGNFQTISGGSRNYTTEIGATIAGGSNDTATGKYAVISGGYRNRTEGDTSTIGGGHRNWNVAGATASVIAGGSNNRNDVQFSTISGGKRNRNFDVGGTIGGGENNNNLYQYAVIGGGQKNVTGDNGATIAGGESQKAYGLNSTIGGGYGNQTYGDVGTIAGGNENLIDYNSPFSFIGGGDTNVITTRNSAIAGGLRNKIHSTGDYSVIAGGRDNRIEKIYSFIGGGDNNWSRGQYSSVIGGNSNEAGGDYSTVLNGAGNVAGGFYSLSAGKNCENQHSYVTMFTDGQTERFNSRISSQFMIRMANGLFVTQEDTSSINEGFVQIRSRAALPNLLIDQVNATANYARIRLRTIQNKTNYWDIAAQSVSGEFNIYRNGTGDVLSLTPTSASNLLMMSNGARLTTGGTWTNSSDRNIKDKITYVDENKILAQLVKMPVTMWHYKTEQSNTMHIGPMAQDFKAAFNLGDSDKSIATVDADGINMAAIKALYNQLQAAVIEIEKLKKEVKILKNKNQQSKKQL